MLLRLRLFDVPLDSVERLEVAALKVNGTLIALLVIRLNLLVGGVLALRLRGNE